MTDFEKRQLRLALQVMSGRVVGLSDEEKKVLSNEPLYEWNQIQYAAETIVYNLLIGIDERVKKARTYYLLGD